MGKRYFFGILPGSPVLKASFGGQAFQDFKERVNIDSSSGETLRVPYKGNGSSGCELEEDEIQLIKTGIENHIARVIMSKEIDGWSGKEITVKVTGNFHSINSRRKYRRIPNDEPAARYVYFLPLDEVKDPTIFEYGNKSFPPSYEEMYLKDKDETKKGKKPEAVGSKS